MFGNRIEGLEKRTLLSAGVVFTADFQPAYNPGYETDLAITPDGHRIAVGTMPGADGNNDVFVARWNFNRSAYLDLDGSFGMGGVTVLDIGGGSDQGVAMALQGDGKIVVVGNDLRNRKTTGFVARLNADGSLDQSFATKGVATLSLDSKSTRFSDVAIWNNKIVVAGNAGGDMIGVRFNSDGSLDSSFGGDGVSRQHFAAPAQAGQMAVTADGRIAMAGYITTAAGQQMALVRYRATGALDNRFSGDGIWTFAYGKYARANAVDVDSNGRLTIAGIVTTKKGYRPSVTRLSGSGKADKKFGAKGWMLAEGTRGEFLTISRRTDGTVVVGGETLPVKQRQALVGFLSHAGINYDSSLDLAGQPVRSIVSTPQEWNYADGVDFTNPKKTLNYGDTPGDSVVQADGKLVVLATTHGGFQLRRFNADGSPDVSFGHDGWSDAYLPVNQYIANGRTSGQQLTLLDDGSFLVLANRTRDIDPFNGCVVAKYTPSGVFDPSFNKGAPLQIDGGTDDTTPDSLQVAPNGNIIINITDWQGGTETHILNPDGSFISVSLAPFDNELKRQRPNDTINSYFDRLFADDTGEYLTTGLTNWNDDPNSVTFAVKHRADGSIDTSFGTNGVLIDSADPLGTLQNDGSFLRWIYPQADQTTMELVRHDAQGNLVNSFGTKGHATINVGPNAHLRESHVLGDGKIVVSGWTETDAYGSSGTGRAFVFRLNADGTLDGRFKTSAQPIYYTAAASIADLHVGEGSIVNNQYRVAVGGSGGQYQVLKFDL